MVQSSPNAPDHVRRDDVDAHLFRAAREDRRPHAALRIRARATGEAGRTSPRIEVTERVPVPQPQASRLLARDGKWWASVALVPVREAALHQSLNPAPR